MKNASNVAAIHAELYPGHTQPVMIRNRDTTDSKYASHTFLPIERRRFHTHVESIKQAVSLRQSPQDFRDLYHDRWYGDHIHVANSSLHGKGLFATSDIPPWSIVTLFPVDYVEHAKPVEDGLARMFQPCRYSYGKQCDPFDAMMELQDTKCYSLTVNDLPMSALMTPAGIQTTIYGDPGNQRYGELGHYINDPGHLSETPSPEEYSQYLSTFTKSNVMFFIVANYTVAVVTTRGISSGEEILLTYGESFWSPSLLNRRFSPSIQHQVHARDAINYSITKSCIDVFSHAP